jgi:antitoxin component of RelBE/YafQ-DinJ toxin-antitoxin module
MPKNITMNIRLDEDTRRELRDFAAEIGIPATTLVNASIKQMLRTREVTFSAALEPTPGLEEAVREAMLDYKTKSNITITETDEETLAHLRSL